MARFTVEGYAPFPLDMLRKDHCWPASEIDAQIIASTLAEQYKAKVMVELESDQPHHRHTPARWESFGWEYQPVRTGRAS